MLGWRPRHSSLDALTELFTGIAVGEGQATPPLEPDREHSRLAELRTRQGAESTPE